MLQTLAGIGCLLVVAALVCTIHGLAYSRTASETGVIQRENARLRRSLDEAITGLAKSQVAELQADLTFAQLWSKSGLGHAAVGLGIGPLETTAKAAPAWQETASGTATKNHVSAPDPTILALGPECERIETDALALQTSLGDMLEYFHDAKLLLSNTPSIEPVPNAHSTSPFGTRKDPYQHNWVMHKGLDLAGPAGAEIVAPADGVAIFTGFRGGYGRTLVIDHGYGIQTHYAHLSAIEVVRGARVQRGDVIAKIGNTGKSTGPHLHYEVRRLGHPLNPARFILD